MEKLSTFHGQILEAESWIADQDFAIRSILDHVLETSDYCARPRADHSTASLRDPSHNVLVIDGARGAGKTSTLTTILAYVNALNAYALGSSDATGVTSNPGEFLEPVCDLHKKWKIGRGGGRRPGERLVYVLDLIHTSSLEVRHSTMESIISSLSQKLSIEIEAARKFGGARGQDRETKLGELRKSLLENVARSWYLSQDKGQEAILRDSTTYKNFLQEYANASHESYRRVQAWHKFVDEFLDKVGASVLLVAFDDADVEPEITCDLLHTIRIFLNAPNIITVFACNMFSVRQALFAERLKKLAHTIDAMASHGSPAAHDMREKERLHTEEYLEKTLPRQKRYYLDLATDDIMRKPSGDIRKVVAALEGKSDHAVPASEKNRQNADAKALVTAGLTAETELTYDKFCVDVMKRYRNRFLLAKAGVDYRYWMLQRDSGGKQSRSDLEYFLSWWLYRRWYGHQLRPRSLRQLIVMHDFFAECKHPQQNGKGHQEDGPPKKRLAAVLMQNPLNASLVSRLSDVDSNIFDWFSRQNIESKWTGARELSIEGWNYAEPSYTYHFLMYRLDLEASMPTMESRSRYMPRNFLPTITGPNLTGWGAFWPGTDYGVMLGVGMQIAHSALPSNCVYMYDLQCLPDVAFEEKGKSLPDERWTFGLAHEWPAFFARISALPRAPASFFSERQNGGESKRFFLLHESTFDEAYNDLYMLLDKAGARWEKSRLHQYRDSYLVNVVFPLASIGASQLLPKMTFRADTSTSRVEQTLLHHELDDGDKFIRKWQEECLTFPWMGKYAPTADHPARIQSVTERAKRLGSIGSTDERLRLVQYEMLVNDLRATWLAFRILIHQIPDAFSRRMCDSTAGGQTGEVNLHQRHLERRDRFSRDDLFSTHFSLRSVLRYWLAPASKLIDALKTWKSPLPQVGDRKSKQDLDYFAEYWGAPNPNVPVAMSEDLYRIATRLVATERIGNYLHSRIYERNRNLVQQLNEIGKEFGFSGVDQSGNLTIARKTLDAILSAETFSVLWEGDLACPPNPENDGVKRKRQHKASEIGRSFRIFLMFVGAISSRLPSLIHLEIANVMYMFAKGSGPESVNTAQALLEQWLRFTLSLLAVVREIEDCFEFMKLKLDLATHGLYPDLLAKCADGAKLERQEALKDGLSKVLDLEHYWIRLTILPDGSYPTLGISGTMGFGYKQIKVDPKAPEVNEPVCLEKWLPGNPPLWADGGVFQIRQWKRGDRNGAETQPAQYITIVANDADPTNRQVREQDVVEGCELDVSKFGTEMEKAYEFWRRSVFGQTQVNLIRTLEFILAMREVLNAHK